MSKTQSLDSSVDPELIKYLNKVQRIFDVEKLTHQRIDNKSVVDYYSQSDYGYRVFHSTQGSIHMALNFDGEFDEKGYYGQAKLVQQYVDRLHPKLILELGSGKGFNSSFLAKNNKNTKFVGVDLTPLHVSFAQARRERENIRNLSFEIGDFQRLGFPSETFDMLFEVESICHASDMTTALSEALRVLKPGGYFILFDGFREPSFDELNPDVQTASRLVEISMAISHPWIINEWLIVAQSVGFTIEKAEDISQAIMPNLMKFQYLARGYFKFPVLSNLLLRVLPPQLVKNSIAGLLMPLTVKAGAQGYYMVVLRK